MLRNWVRGMVYVTAMAVIVTNAIALGSIFYLLGVREKEEHEK